MKKYKYIGHIVTRLVNTTPQCMDFVMYRHLVEMRSFSKDVFSAAIYEGRDKHSAELAIFYFDHSSRHLLIEKAQEDAMAQAIIKYFTEIYPRNLKINNQINKENL